MKKRLKNTSKINFRLGEKVFRIRERKRDKSKNKLVLKDLDFRRRFRKVLVLSWFLILNDNKLAESISSLPSGLFDIPPTKKALLMLKKEIDSKPFLNYEYTSCLFGFGFISGELLIQVIHSFFIHDLIRKLISLIS